MPSKTSTTKKPAKTSRTSAASKTTQKVKEYTAHHRFGTIFLIIAFCVCLIAVSARVGILIYEKFNSYTEHGSEFSFALTNDAPHGYHWEYVLDGDNYVGVSYKYDDNGCPAGSDSCIGSNVYTVRAKKEGNARLALKYCYVDESVPCEYVTYDLHVNKDLNILESHHGSYYDVME